MKRCHVSGGRDGLKEHNLLRDLWHCSAPGEGEIATASPSRGGRFSARKKRPRDVIDAAEPQPPGKAQSG